MKSIFLGAFCALLVSYSINSKAQLSDEALDKIIEQNSPTIEQIFDGLEESKANPQLGVILGVFLEFAGWRVSNTYTSQVQKLSALKSRNLIAFGRTTTVTEAIRLINLEINFANIDQTRLQTLESSLEQGLGLRRAIYSETHINFIVKQLQYMLEGSNTFIGENSFSSMENISKDIFNAESGSRVYRGQEIRFNVKGQLLTFQEFFGMHERTFQIRNSIQPELLKSQILETLVSQFEDIAQYEARLDQTKSDLKRIIQRREALISEKNKLYSLSRSTTLQGSQRWQKIINRIRWGARIAVGAYVWWAIEESGEFANELPKADSRLLQMQLKDIGRDQLLILLSEVLRRAKTEQEAIELLENIESEIKAYLLTIEETE